MLSGYVCGGWGINDEGNWVESAIPSDILTPGTVQGRSNFFTAGGKNEGAFFHPFARHPDFRDKSFLYFSLFGKERRK
jgi:hypothetical protein